MFVCGGRVLSYHKEHMFLGELERLVEWVMVVVVVVRVVYIIVSVHIIVIGVAVALTCLCAAVSHRRSLLYGQE